MYYSDNEVLFIKKKRQYTKHAPSLETGARRGASREWKLGGGGGKVCVTISWGAQERRC